MIRNDKEIRDAVTNEVIAGKIVGYNHYEIDGIKISIELREDIHSSKASEYYPDFKKEPVYTKEGRPLTLALEDACLDAKHRDRGLCIDCTGCKFYKKVNEHTLFGVCMNNKKMKK